MKKTALFAAVIMLTGSMALAVNESEPNDSTGSADAIGAIPINPSTVNLNGGFPQGYGNGATDDYWSFSAVSGNTYEFVASQDSSISGGLDIGMEMRDSGSQLALVDDGGVGVPETLTYSATATETLYLVVYEATAFINGTDGYTVVCSITVNSVEDWTLY